MIRIGPPRCHGGVPITRHVAAQCNDRRRPTMASQARTRPAAQTPRPAGAFRPIALPALAAAIQAVRGGRPERATPRQGR